MTSFGALWMPIVLSAVLVFVVSSIVHMVLPWHKSDFKSLPSEDKVMDALRPFAMAPGDYMMPRPSSMADMKTQAYIDKVNRGPKIVMTVLPPGMRGMGSNLLNWFLFSVVVSAMAGFLGCIALGPGAEYSRVFHIVGGAAFMAYAFGVWPLSIWYNRSWSTSLKTTFDGLIYAMVTAGTFGWLWPR